MMQSVLDAIELGLFDFEPQEVREDQYEPTAAPPGSEEKILVLGDRLRRGLPLWHPSDHGTLEARIRLPD
jgi:hypothetical protein